MPSPTQPTPNTAVSEAELDVLKSLWQHGPATVRQTHQRLTESGKDWAYNTVLTLLTRLRDKSVVTSKQLGTALEFTPVVSRQNLILRRLDELVDRVCDGSASPLVHALVQSKQLSSQDAQQLRKLLDDLESSSEPGSTKNTRKKGANQ